MEAVTVQDLVAIVAGYRGGDTGPLDAAHVQTWLDQFEEEDRDFVLAETTALLRRTYLSEGFLIDSVRTLLTSVAELSPSAASIWKHVSFLLGQPRSASQRYMVKLAADLIERAVGIRPTRGLDAPILVYLDDISGTGNQMKQELLELRSLTAKDIHVLHVVHHTSDYQQRIDVRYALEAEAHSVVFGDRIVAENRRAFSPQSSVLYPYQLGNGRYTSWWMKMFTAEQIREMLRRGPGAGLFTSPEARDRYEAIMLEKGAFICSLPRIRTAAIKPLGFKTYPGFGFGMLYVTSRNCPNNAPLAWWWGDRASRLATLNRWYPLLERRTRGNDAGA